MLDRSKWDTLTPGRKLTRLRQAKQLGDTSLDAEITTVESELQQHRREQKAENERKRRASEATKEAELQEKAQAVELTTSDNLVYQAIAEKKRVKRAKTTELRRSRSVAVRSRFAKLANLRHRVHRQKTLRPCLNSSELTS